MNVIFVIDVGNTNVKIGLARPEGGLFSTYALPTGVAACFGTSDAWGLRLLDICRAEGCVPEDVRDIVVSSVVPAMNPIVRRACARFFRRRARFVPADVALPIENRYARPREVGADRLVTAFAARRLETARTLVVADFGTATTLDCVRDDAYLGGLICPGVLSSARALATGTAQLPQISLEIEGPLHVGVSTAESLNQGLIYGFAAMIEGLARRIVESVGERPGAARVIATGGFAPAVAAVCPTIDVVREDLLLEGLLLAREEAAASSSGS